MSLKKFVYLCLFAVIGAMGTLCAPNTMAQVGHGTVPERHVSGINPTQADAEELKGLLKTSLLPAMMTLQQALSLAVIDPEAACRAGKVADGKLADLRAGLIRMRERFITEGKTTVDLQAFIAKIDAMLVDGRRPGDIFCDSNMKPANLSADERAILAKISGYIAEYTSALTQGLQAALDNDVATACPNYKAAQQVLFELDTYLTELRAAKLKENQDIAQYDRLLVINSNNKQQLAKLILQSCPAS